MEVMQHTSVDVTSKVYPPLLEVHQVKHEVVVLLTELQIHGLLPETVSFASDSQAEMPEAEGTS